MEFVRLFANEVKDQDGRAVVSHGDIDLGKLVGMPEFRQNNAQFADEAVYNGIGYGARAGNGNDEMSAAPVEAHVQHTSRKPQFELHPGSIAIRGLCLDCRQNQVARYPPPPPEEFVKNLFLGGNLGGVAKVLPVTTAARAKNRAGR